MVVDEEANLFVVGGLDPETLQDGLDRVQAALDAIGIRHALAHIVEQQREEKQLGALELGINLSEPSLPLTLRRPPRAQPESRGSAARAPAAGRLGPAIGAALARPSARPRRSIAARGAPYTQTGPVVRSSLATRPAAWE